MSHVQDTFKSRTFKTLLKYSSIIVPAKYAYSIKVKILLLKGLYDYKVVENKYKIFLQFLWTFS